MFLQYKYISLNSSGLTADFILMDIFFSLSTIGIFLFIRGLYVVSNKAPFGLLSLRGSSEADLDQVIIRDGRVIYPGDPDHPLPFGRNIHDVSVDNQTVESQSPLPVEDEKTADTPPLHR